MKIVAPLILTILLSACASVEKYSYQSQDSQGSLDPEFIFGDRFGGGAVASPARTFDINTVSPVLNKCSDYSRVGTTSNHWSRVAPKTIQIRTPAGKAVALSGGYLASSGFSSSSCLPPLVMLNPKNGATYSVDIDVVNKRCMLSIVQRLPDGKTESVTDVTVLPACQK